MNKTLQDLEKEIETIKTTQAGRVPASDSSRDPSPLDQRLHQPLETQVGRLHVDHPPDSLDNYQPYSSLPALFIITSQALIWAETPCLTWCTPPEV